VKKIIALVAILIAIVVMNSNNAYSQSSDSSVCFSKTTYTIKVNCTKTIKESITSCNFGRFDNNINDKNFPSGVKLTDSIVEMSARLVSFNCKWIPYDKVAIEMNKVGYRPATLRELLAFAEKYSRLSRVQKKFIILAFGSCCYGLILNYPAVPGLHFDGGMRQLDLYCDDMEFNWSTVVFSFLAVQK